VATIRAWWYHVGRRCYAGHHHVLILADGGGANSDRSWRWKAGLQALADEFTLTITVLHYPPGASKWNPIEHRLFSHVSRTWAATPLTSYDVVLDGLRSTTTSTGLWVEATLFDATYKKGLTVTDEEMDSLLIEKHTVCPQWNYTIQPRKSGSNF
jgi:hypothetical protein